MKNRFSSIFLLLPCLVPLIWRLLTQGLSQPIGLLSDLCAGLWAYGLCLLLPHWFRVGILALWSAFQIGAWELFGAMQRFPAWEDLHYLTDPSFVEKSASGLHLSYPGLALLLLGAVLSAAVFRSGRPKARHAVTLLAVALLFAVTQGALSRRHDNQSLAARYNPLHWFVQDIGLRAVKQPPAAMKASLLPADLRKPDLSGTPFLKRKGVAKNALIVILEGIPGLYHPEIAKAMGVAASDGVLMHHLAKSAPEAMLIPDLTAHSHQTIRGLYAILCGDVSKLSNETPKAFELLEHPDRARDCLPAIMAGHGWSTHYLQAANLMFMGKDRVMPAIGFQEVHGVEWFTEPNPYPFPWGVIDPVFFRGARKYINDLQSAGKPWMLTLLTVGTHQPYAVPDDIAAKYASRKLATVAILDEAVGEFLEGLRQDGVLEDTLVVVTADESHGSDLAEWMSAWVLGMALAPEHAVLPRLKQGGYGLVDITVSVLDYFGLEIPQSLIGRSFFRDYPTSREMMSFTAAKLRWRTAEGIRYECNWNGGCRYGEAPSILGDPPQPLAPAPQAEEARRWAMAAALDHALTSTEEVQVLRFAGGEIRKLPEKLLPESEWSENLAGAQYLNFPAGSKVDVSIRAKAVEAPETGIRLKLFIRQYEILTTDIPYPEFPVLHAGETGGIDFGFENPKEKNSFSFHLVGEGRNAAVQLLEFTVRVDRRGVGDKK